MNDRIFEKLDKIDERLNSIDKTLERNTISLEYHIKRTDILQNEVEKMNEDLTPVEDHVKKVHFILKVGSMLGGIVLFIMGVLKGFGVL